MTFPWSAPARASKLAGIFRVRGVEVRVDPSFVVVALFFVWLLATSFFPGAHADLSASRDALWWMAGAAGIGLFLSLVAHELAHALVARREGVAVQSVSLFLLGGVSDSADEPRSPRSEVIASLAGPMTSLALAAVFFALAAMLGDVDGAAAAVVVLRYLASLNVLLALFNLLPAFPLDGGRILRALLWRKGRSLASATELAAGFGRAFGVVFIVTGVLFILAGSFVTGAWWALIGLFLRQAAQRATATVVAGAVLAGERIERFIRPVNVVVPSTTSLHSFLFDYVYRYRERAFPVVDAAAPSRFLGVARARSLSALLRLRLRALSDRVGLGGAAGSTSSALKQRSVASILEEASAENAVGLDVDAAGALARMRSAGSELIYVVDGEAQQLRGIVLASDLQELVALKLEVAGAPTIARSRRRVSRPARAWRARAAAAT